MPPCSVLARSNERTRQVIVTFDLVLRVVTSGTSDREMRKDELLVEIGLPRELRSDSADTDHRCASRATRPARATIASRSAGGDHNGIGAAAAGQLLAVAREVSRFVVARIRADRSTRDWHDRTTSPFRHAANGSEKKLHGQLSHEASPITATTSETNFGQPNACNAIVSTLAKHACSNVTLQDADDQVARHQINSE